MISDRDGGGHVQVGRTGVGESGMAAPKRARDAPESASLSLGKRVLYWGIMMSFSVGVAVLLCELVIWQFLPQPSVPRYDRIGSARSYGYVEGDILPPAGHIRVTVSENKTVVDYIRAFRPEDERGDRKNGANAYSYTINAD